MGITVSLLTPIIIVVQHLDGVRFPAQLVDPSPDAQQSRDEPASSGE